MKLLIIRFSSIGDIVLTTPVVRCLALQTKAEVHYLTKKCFGSIVQNNPYLKKIWLFDNSDKNLIQQLRAEKFDGIIDLHNNLRSIKISWQLSVKRNTFNKLNFEKWILVRFKKNILPPIHIVDRYLAAVKKLGIVNDGKGLDFFIDEKNTVDTTSLFTNTDIFLKTNAQLTTNNQQLTTNNYVALVIGAAHATKRLPTHKLIELINSIKQPIILIGGKDDTAVATEIENTVLRNDVVNTCGKLNLQQSASIIQNATYVITHDTGMMHIAAAFDKKIISVWGNTVPEFGMYPYLKTVSQQLFADTHINEVKNLPCRPCSKIGFNTCPKKHFACMELQNVESIAETANYMSNLD